MPLLRVTAAAALLVLPLQAVADDYGTLDTTDAAHVQMTSASAPCSSDEVLRTLYESNLKELRLVSLALTRAQDPKVVGYLHQLQNDHTFANVKVIALARAQGVDLGPGPDEHELQPMLESYLARSGADFDQALVQHMVGDHREDIAMVQAAHQNLSANADPADAAVDDLLVDMTPTLDRHLDEAEQLQAGLTA